MRRALIVGGGQALIAVAFVAVAVGLRGNYVGATFLLNPDEAELMAQARAAMRSPVPFTTWTTATTGPIWVLFLALLGAVGLPLTIAFGHLLAAVLIGVLGYQGYTLARRGLSPVASAVITVCWWLPIVLTLAGIDMLHRDIGLDVVDFAPLATELLPCVLILGAALIRSDALVRRPVLFVASGLLCGLAVGAKYQAAPVAVALLVVQVILGGDYRWRAMLRAAVLWGAAALLPFLVLGLAMVISSDVSGDAIRINLAFLSNYGSGATLAMRMANWRDLITQMHVFLMLFVVAWLGVHSTARVRACRAILVASGLAAAYAGGMGFGHYLYFVYLVMAMAIGLPLKADGRLIPVVRQRWLMPAAVVVAMVVGYVVSFGPSRGSASIAGRHDLTTALSSNSVRRDPRLLAACPAGSTVAVWGWAGELYVNYSWKNAIPFMNVSQITSAAENYERGYRMMRQAIDDRATTCVVDAVGSPFFALPPSMSLTTQYPQLGGLLDEEYRRADRVVDCEACLVYVRR